MELIFFWQRLETFLPKVGFTLLALLKCLERQEIPQSEKTIVHLDLIIISKVTGFDLTSIEKLIKYLVAAEYYLIMSRQEEDLSLLLEKFQCSCKN